MDTEQLVQMITEQVLARLSQQPAPAPLKAPMEPSKIMVLFTGGTIGLVEGLAAVREIGGLPVEITVVLSTAAEKVIGTSRIKDSLGTQCPVLTGQEGYPRALLRAADVLVIPVLTQNTLSKVALTFADTTASTLIMQALMMGKPVIAARNAADPQDHWRIEAGMGKATPAFMRVLQQHLQQAESYGIQLLDVRELSGAVRNWYDKRLQRQADQPAKATTGAAEAAVAGHGRKTFISAEVIKAAALAGNKSYRVEAGAILTPLARDIARDCGLELLETV